MLPWTSPRRFLSALLLIVGVVAAAVSMPLSPAGAQAVGADVAPPEAGTLVGSSAKGGTATLAALEAKLGKTLAAHRVFNSGFRVDILNDPQVQDDKAMGRTTVYSVKLPWAQVIDGSYDADITEMANLLEVDGRNIFLAFNHEPEDNGDPALFRAAFTRFGRLVHAVGALNVRVTLIHMEWSHNPKSGRDFMNWVPALDSFDVYALDGYIHPSKVDRSFAELTRKGHDFAKSVGKGFAIAEWGVVATDGDAGQRARTISEGLAHAKAQGFEFVTWFHSDIGQNAPPGGWYLDSNNDQAAVSAFAAALAGGGGVATEANRAYVRALFADLLGRIDTNANSTAIEFWAVRLATETRAQVAAAIQKGSTEYYGRVVDAAYEAFLARQADIAGRSFYVDAWRTRARTMESIVVALVGSSEYYRSKGLDDGAFVDAAYLDIMGRAPSGIEQADGLSVVAAAGRPMLARQLEVSLERRRRFVLDAYDTYLGHAPLASALDYWVGRLEGGLRREAYVVAMVASSEYFNAQT